MNNHECLSSLRGKLIVSCQALESEPLYCDERSLMGYMAKAASMGGAGGIRANSVRDIIAIQKEVQLPVIGIIKKEYANSEVYITPTLREVDALVAAQCQIIAMDATERPRPGGQTLDALFTECRKKYPNQLFMADCSSYEEGLHAASIGFDVVATTLAGYTPYTQGMELPALSLIRSLRASLSCPVIAEGGIWTPEELCQVFQSGAYAAVVGTAITRPMAITQRFVRALTSLPEKGDAHEHSHP